VSRSESTPLALPSSSLPSSTSPRGSDPSLLFLIYHPTSSLDRRFLQRHRFLEDGPVHSIHHARRRTRRPSRSRRLPDHLGMLKRRLFHGLLVPFSRCHPHLQLPLLLIPSSLQEPLFTLLERVPEGRRGTGLVTRRKRDGGGFLDLEKLFESLLTEDERLEEGQRVGKRPVERQGLLD
jgi:hypothetical protein